MVKLTYWEFCKGQRWRNKQQADNFLAVLLSERDFPMWQKNNHQPLSDGWEESEKGKERGLKKWKRPIWIQS